jgi:hypothetical protein
MRLRASVAALFVLAAVAGCLAAPGQTMTMRDGLSDARAAAEDWWDNLQFAFAGAIEPFKRIEDRDGDGTLRGEYVTHLDGNPGDGRAPGWIYGFLADDGRCVLVVLAAGLGVLAEGWEECDADDVAPLPANVLDSDDVAALLADFEGWPVPDKSTLATWELLAEPEGDAYWLVMSSNETTAAAAAVDAVTGNITLLEPGFFGPAAPGEAGTSYDSAYAWGSGPAVTVATPFTMDLEVGPGATLGVTASISSSVMGPATLVVEAPSGEVVFEDPFVGSTSTELQLDEAGTYQVRIEHGNVALSPSLSLFAIWAY